MLCRGLAMLTMLVLVGCGPAAYRWAGGDYTVRPGDTLYSIAFNSNLDYRALARWNGIEQPYTIYPGQQLRLTPPPGMPGAVAEREPPPSAPSPNQRSRRTPEPGNSQRRPSGDGAAVDAVSKWQWPVRGPLLGSTASGKDPKGLNIGGEVGKPIHAAAGGRVVYSGNGLPGYGLLLIIKHNEHFLSAYGHNSRLAVQEGDRVRAGDVIARMGLGPQRQPMLYFEIRRNGKPVDPKRFLP